MWHLASSRDFDQETRLRVTRAIVHLRLFRCWTVTPFFFLSTEPFRRVSASAILHALHHLKILLFFIIRPLLTQANSSAGLAATKVDDAISTACLNKMHIWCMSNKLFILTIQTSLLRSSTKSPPRDRPLVFQSHSKACVALNNSYLILSYIIISWWQIFCTRS